jgi:predicted ArsR family transcriptional regulator
VKEWTFITSHGAVLSVIAKHGKIKALDIALEIGITERSVRRIIADLLTEGYINKKTEGGINRYYIRPQLSLRRPEMRDIKVNDFIQVFAKDIRRQRRRPSLGA